MRHLSSYLRQVSQDTFSSLYVRNYRIYYIGQIISTSGTFMQNVAQAWLVLKLTNSGTDLGITIALQYVPILFLGPIGGIVADRVSKRKILFLTQSASGLLALILGILVATNLVNVWMVYTLALLLGIVTVFDSPTRQTFYFELVGENNLRNAITLYSTLFNLARVIGPAIAGALIASVGMASCFIINGISYAAVVIVLAMMNTKELHITPPVPRAKGQLREGLQYVLSTPVLASTLLMMGIIGAFTFEFTVSLPLIAQFTYKGDASSFAFLTSALGLGAAAGGIVFASRKGITPSRLVSAAFLFGATTLAAALMPNLLLCALVLVVVGICSINFSSLGNTILQLESSPQMRGRVMAFWSVVWVGSSAFGGPVVGWFAQLGGGRWGLGFSGVTGVIAAILGAITMRSILTRKTASSQQENKPA
jgi:MFS family permease